MLEASTEELFFRFPDVHDEAIGTVTFHRTLRIPDDNNEYPLPAGIGEFPIYHVDDYSEKLPSEWTKRGGVFLPMHQCEALWISFDGQYPMAIKVAAGKIDAVSGEGWSESIHSDPQDYVVLTEQPWLDGFNVGDALIRQFVAMPLGAGFTAEEQLTGKAEFGGIQFWVCPLKAEIYEEKIRKPRLEAERLAAEERSRGWETLKMAQCEFDDHMMEYDMGLSPGGLMRQKIYRDHFGLEAWNQGANSRCFVHLINSTQFSSVTGKPAPTTPITPLEYAAQGIPWFEHYAENESDIAAAKQLAGLDSIAAMRIKRGLGPQPDNDSIVDYLSKNPNVLGRGVQQSDF
ncbi:MAG: hypothetical protein AAFX44_03935 [Pseudomonadota bacterium]